VLQIRCATHARTTDDVSMRSSVHTLLLAASLGCGAWATHGCSAGGGGDGPVGPAGSGGAEAGPETGGNAGAGAAAQGGNGATAGSSGFGGEAGNGGNAGASGSAGSAGSAGNAGNGGARAPAHFGSDLVSNAFVATSTHYKIVGSLGQGPGGNTVMRSANFKLHGGLVGATQAP
jgi:hypothetical protein